MEIMKLLGGVHHFLRRAWNWTMRIGDERSLDELDRAEANDERSGLPF